MPNHVRNILTIDVSESSLTLDEVFDRITSVDPKTGEVLLDFEAIVGKCPEELDIEESSRGHCGYEFYCNLLKTKKADTPIKRRNWIRKYIADQPKPENEQEARNLMNAETLNEYLNIGKQYYDNEKKYGRGIYTWYGWKNKYFGTKWNAYDQFGQDNTIQFSTAWSAPYPVYETLGHLFPDVKFSVDYAEEFIGEYSGTIKIHGDEFVETDMSIKANTTPAERNKAISFACGVWGGTPEDFNYRINPNTGEYEYHYEDEDEEEA